MRNTVSSTDSEKVTMDASTACTERGGRQDILLRAVLAMPLVYIVFDWFPFFAREMSKTGRAHKSYLIASLLDGIPLAVWVLALVLLVLDTDNLSAWTAVGLGGLAVSVYGLLFFLEVDHELNRFLAFGLYTVLLSLWEVLGRRRAKAYTPSAPGPDP